MQISYSMEIDETRELVSKKERFHPRKAEDEKNRSHKANRREHGKKVLIYW
mgnify:CR=1 FL=1